MDERVLDGACLTARAFAADTFIQHMWLRLTVMHAKTLAALPSLLGGFTQIVTLDIVLVGRGWQTAVASTMLTWLCESIGCSSTVRHLTVFLLSEILTDRLMDAIAKPFPSLVSLLVQEFVGLQGPVLMGLQHCTDLQALTIRAAPHVFAADRQVAAVSKEALQSLPYLPKLLSLELQIQRECSSVALCNKLPSLRDVVLVCHQAGCSFDTMLSGCKLLESVVCDGEASSVPQLMQRVLANELLLRKLSTWAAVPAALQNIEELCITGIQALELSPNLHLNCCKVLRLCSGFMDADAALRPDQVSAVLCSCPTLRYLVFDAGVLPTSTAAMQQYVTALQQATCAVPFVSLEFDLAYQQPARKMGCLLQSLQLWDNLHGLCLYRCVNSENGLPKSIFDSMIASLQRVRVLKLGNELLMPATPLMLSAFQLHKLVLGLPCLRCLVLDVLPEGDVVAALKACPVSRLPFVGLCISCTKYTPDASGADLLNCRLRDSGCDGVWFSLCDPFGAV